MNCSQCNPYLTLPVKGMLTVKHPNPSIMASVAELTNTELNALSAEVPYNSLKVLEQILYVLEEAFSERAAEFFSFALSSETGNENMQETLFAEFRERIGRPDLLEVIVNEQFTTHYQPILDLQSNNVYGYELLLRPIESGHPFFPYELFQYAQKSGLQSLLDSRARVASIRNSAQHVPAGIKRFINFLPSSIYDPNHCLRTTFKAAAETGTDPADLVFEVVETEEIHDMGHLKGILDVYKQKGMKVALDDLGAGFSTTEVLGNLQPQYVKLDRGLISFCDQDEQKQAKILEIVEMADSIGTVLLAEGIERAEEADWCRNAGLHLGQGYFFGKPSSHEVYFSVQTALR